MYINDSIAFSVTRILYCNSSPTMVGGLNDAFVAPDIHGVTTPRTQNPLDSIQIISIYTKYSNKYYFIKKRLAFIPRTVYHA